VSEDKKFHKNTSPPTQNVRGHGPVVEMRFFSILRFQRSYRIFTTGHGAVSEVSWASSFLALDVTALAPSDVTRRYVSG